MVTSVARPSAAPTPNPLSDYALAAFNRVLDEFAIKFALGNGGCAIVASVIALGPPGRSDAGNWAGLEEGATRRAHLGHEGKTLVASSGLPQDAAGHFSARIGLDQCSINHGTGKKWAVGKAPLLATGYVTEMGVPHDDSGNPLLPFGVPDWSKLPKGYAPADAVLGESAFPPAGKFYS